MPPIHVMIKPASGLCNMRCSYCFYADEMEHREQPSCGIMKEEVLETIIRQTLSFAEGNCTFAYQGGEPTLAGLDFFRKSIELQEKYNENHVKIQNSLQTNGYALNEEWCQFFAEHHILVGISVDGVKATHDACRKDASGGDSFSRVMHSVSLLKQYQVEYNVLTVVNARTAPRIRRIYEQYKKQDFFYQQYIACMDPLGELPGGREYSLTPEMYGQFLMELFELWEIDLRKGNQPYIRQFENWIGILMGYRPESCEQNGICGIQNIIEADGSVYPCDFYVLDDYCLGNLMEDSFETIYMRREASGFIEKSKNHDAACLQCRYFVLCRGGCNRHRTVGVAPQDIGRNIFCKSYRMFFDKYYDRMAEIARSVIRRKNNG